MPLPPDGDPRWGELADAIKEFRRRRPDHDRRLMEESQAIRTLIDRDMASSRIERRREAPGAWPRLWLARAIIPALAAAAAITLVVIASWSTARELEVVGGIATAGDSLELQPGVLIVARSGAGVPEPIAVVEAVGHEGPHVRLFATDTPDGAYEVDLVALPDLPTDAVVAGLAGRDGGLEILGSVPFGPPPPALLTEYVVTRKDDGRVVARQGRTGIAWFGRDEPDGDGHARSAQWTGYLPKTNLGGAGAQVYAISPLSDETLEGMEGRLWDSLAGETDQTFDTVSSILNPEETRINPRGSVQTLPPVAYFDAASWQAITPVPGSTGSFSGWCPISSEAPRHCYTSHTACAAHQQLRGTGALCSVANFTVSEGDHLRTRFEMGGPMGRSVDVPFLGGLTLSAREGCQIVGMRLHIENPSEEGVFLGVSGDQDTVMAAFLMASRRSRTGAPLYYEGNAMNVAYVAGRAGAVLFLHAPQCVGTEPDALHYIVGLVGPDGLLRTERRVLAIPQLGDELLESP